MPNVGSDKSLPVVEDDTSKLWGTSSRWSLSVGATSNRAVLQTTIVSRRDLDLCNENWWTIGQELLASLHVGTIPGGEFDDEDDVSVAGRLSIINTVRECVNKRKSDTYYEEFCRSVFLESSSPMSSK